MKAHIRRPNRRSRSTSYYLDRGPVTPATYCGEPPTDLDWDRRSALAKQNRDEAARVCCLACFLGLARELREPRR